MTNKTETNNKSFFEKMGELLNKPLPGTEANPSISKENTQANANDENSILTRIRDILNTPLPGSEIMQEQLEGKLVDLESELSEEDFVENWWEADWQVFKEHQDQDRKGLNMKQRMDQEGFAQYQEQERLQFEAYQNKEFEVFQAQQQAKINWIQNQQLAQAAGVQVTGMVPPAPPVAPLAPEMPTPPWMNNNTNKLA